MRKRSFLYFTILFVACVLFTNRSWAILGGGDLVHTLIGGSTKLAPLFPEVVKLESRASSCSGTIIGPRAIMTAAHCATPQPTIFRYAGERYPVTFVVSRRYKSNGHDIGIAITKRDIKNARYGIIGSRVVLGEPLHLLGYGCTKSGGRGQAGQLKMGTAQISALDSNRIVSQRGSALCFGDSGGPAFVRRGQSRYLVGVNSAGNIRNTNIDIRLDSKASQEFFAKAIARFDLGICGINLSCTAHAPKL